MNDPLRSCQAGYSAPATDLDVNPGDASIIVASRIRAAQWVVQMRRLAPRAGFEPTTIRLTVECSTAELPRNGDGLADKSNEDGTERADGKTS